MKDFEKYGITSFDHIEPSFGNNAFFVAIGQLYDNSNPEAKKVTLNFVNEIDSYFNKLGGICFGFKGQRAKLIGALFSPSYARFLSTLKKAIDPNCIMNPGLYGI